MTATLQEAIAVARDGDTERAQLLAAEVVQDNPDDANAWYLLSQLVDSDARRAAYLSKTLTLDPSHARARAEFDALPTEASAVLAVPAAVAVAALEPDIAVVAVEPELLPADEPADVPEWLQPLSPEPTPVAVAPVYESEPVAVAAEPAPVPATAPLTPAAPLVPAPATSAPRRQTPPPPPPRPQGNGALMALLVLLGLLTLAVLAILAYLLLF